ncbi:fad nad-binding domain-containing protein [Phaffia rhodozyma]|uniref:Kynurenine 3-monooxygenase n=1 Tax=Phaffia rhodozyma TaxID=264483 RepID=A0A0F7SVL4_PHARH|nr:fad nad-binding domain-containing protein [Phaffia rhodozyma]
MSTPTKKAIVVGAGPVGCLSALSLANKGWNVIIWEGRPDPKSPEAEKETIRSVNLAISARGISALHAIEPEISDELLSLALPMKGRMIWDFENKQESQLYDPHHGSAINSISRQIISQTLLDKVSAHPSITVVFNRKIAKIDWARRRLFQEGERGAWVEDGGEEGWDLLVGADGNWSKVRSEIMRVQPSSYSQHQIQHIWIELRLPPGPPNNATGEDSTFSISPEHLHIWPRHEFMLIALPNKDKSFTMTLYAPIQSIVPLNSRAKARAFFRKHFGTRTLENPVDILSMMGEDQVLDDFENARRGGLTTIRVDPVGYQDGSAVLVGDAGHSMVPFYGQGLNAGLEDIRVLDLVFQSHGITGQAGTEADVKQCLKEYSVGRKADLDAILELAMNNYEEMRSHVLTPLHHIRRKLDYVLTTLFPSPPPTAASLSALSRSSGEPFPTRTVNRWTTLYSMVTFRPDVPYAEALRREMFQRKVLGRWIKAVVVGTGAGVFWAVWAGLNLGKKLKLRGHRGRFV